MKEYVDVFCDGCGVRLSIPKDVEEEESPIFCNKQCYEAHQ